MDLLWRRKKNWIGHILRGESLVREVIDGRMIGKRPMGRKTNGYAKLVFERIIVSGIKEKSRKQIGVENMEVKNLPNRRTVTKQTSNKL